MSALGGRMAESQSTTDRGFRVGGRGLQLRMKSSRKGPELYKRQNPRDPCIQITPTLAPKVCKYYLHWAIWILRGKAQNHQPQSLKSLGQFKLLGLLCVLQTRNDSSSSSSSLSASSSWLMWEFVNIQSPYCRGLYSREHAFCSMSALPQGSK